MSSNLIVGMAVILTVIYIALLPLAGNGYGYMGYNGFYRGPSFFYWGGARTYHGRDMREGSLGGPSMRGGGPSSGK